MSIHQPPPKPSLPPLVRLAKMMLDGLTLVEAAIRHERRIREREIASLRREIKALKQQREQRP